jgi:hypothetical protein
MRLVRLKLSKEICDLMKVVTRELALPDSGFGEDLFALLRLKGSGLPSKDRLLATAKRIAAKEQVPWQGVHLLMAKRKTLLEGIVKLPYFHGISVTQKDLVFGVRRMLSTFRTLYLKTRQAQCLGCSLKSQCAFGQQYEKVASDITKVLDPDYQKKVHDNCPHLPEITSANQIAEASRQMHQALSSNNPGMNSVMNAAGVDVDELTGTSAT